MLAEVRTHVLKIWPEFFDAIADGRKTFEVRFDDRGYREGDLLRLREWEPAGEVYTGREITVRVTYILRGWDLPKRATVLSIARCADRPMRVVVESDEEPSLQEMVSPALELRPAVAWFAQMMEAKLRTCDYKGGWKGMSIWPLVSGIQDELRELQVEHSIVEDDRRYGRAPSNLDRVVAEAVDVANYAMMVADVARMCTHARQSNEE